jgi:N-acetylglucosamine kinase-like BadF-type ATPase
MNDLVIGVDGGGTKTVAWLAPLVDDGTSQILGRGIAGPGNPRACGFDVAKDNIAAAIAAAFEEASLARTTVARACIALAGAGRTTEQEQIAGWATEQRIAKRVRICGDAEPVLAAAAADNCGIALIAGTGSLAWGRNELGETSRCGGWGYLLGDEGSAYAIAISGLRAAMQAADGRGPPTDLLPHFLHKLGAPTADALIAKVYSPDMSRDKLAALSQVVFDVATTDEVAGSIVEGGVEDLAEMVVSLARQLNLSNGGYTLAMAGGVFQHQLSYADRVLRAVLDRMHGLHLKRPSQFAIVEEPVQGAVALARAAP